MSLIIFLACTGISALKLSVRVPGDFDEALSANFEMSTAFRDAEKQMNQKDLQDGVFVFIPGATNSRMENLKHTLAWLQTQTVPIECMIFKYQELSVSEDEVKPCKFVNSTGFWMDHLMRVPLHLTKMKYILHVLDGLVIEKLDLRRMMDIMEDNNLVHAAPALYGKGIYPRQYKAMMPHLGFGRKVGFVELHVDMFKRDNFACLQDILDMKDGTGRTINHAGWCVDFMMPSVCKGELGVIDVMKVYKKYRGLSKSGTNTKGQCSSWLKSKGFKRPSLDGNSLGSLKGIVLPDDPQCNGEEGTCKD